MAGDAAKYKIMVYANHCVVKVRTGHITKKRVRVALKAGSLGECEEFLREKRQVEPAQVRRVKGRSRHSSKGVACGFSVYGRDDDLHYVRPGAA